MIEMDIKRDPKLPPVASKSYTLPLKHQEWVRKELKVLEKQELFKDDFPFMFHLL